jgi:transketolase
MRNAFNDVLIEKAQSDESLILLVGDIGFKIFDGFREKFPDRFYNVGIAEANMIGTAAGLAMAGMNPVVYTIIPFLVMRTFEQIRVDLCMQNLPVTLVGVGGGLVYDTLGPTHHAIEDLAIMRALPNMQILIPCDPNETKIVFDQCHGEKGPKYIRLGKGGENNLLSEAEKNDCVLGKSQVLKKGKDILFVSCGPILEEVLKAVERLDNAYDCGVMSIHSLKPFDQATFYEEMSGTRLIVSVEEHSIIGGLGSAIAELTSQDTSRPPLLRIGINDVITNIIGKRDYLLAHHKIDAKGIVLQINKFIERGC